MCSPRSDSDGKFQVERNYKGWGGCDEKASSAEQGQGQQELVYCSFDLSSRPELESQSFGLRRAPLRHSTRTGFDRIGLDVVQGFPEGPHWPVAVAQQ